MQNWTRVYADYHCYDRTSDEHDKKGSLVIWPCLRLGNVAWYRCVVGAETTDDFTWCSKRYLIPPDQVKAQQP